MYDNLWRDSLEAYENSVASLAGQRGAVRGAGAGKPGPITARLQKDYQAIVRGELKVKGSERWLTAIR